MVICRAAVPDKEREASAELADDFGMDEQMSPLAGRQNIEFTNRQLVSLILPMLAEQLLGITVGLADSLMVATVGDASISAVSLVDSVSALMIYIFSAMATGGAVVAGQYLGRREREEACRSAQQLMVLLGVVSLAVTALLYLFRDLIVTRLFGHIDADVMEATNIYYSYVMASIPGIALYADVMEATNIYYSYVMASIPGIALYNGGAALFRTMSRSGVSLKVSLLMNGINVAGNAILIFGLGFDVAGVAIPTLVSRTVAAVVIVWLLFNEKLELHLSDIRAFRFEKRVMRNIFRIAIPSGVENGMFHFGRLILFSLISTFGTASITANAIGNTMGNFHVFAGQAICMGLTTVVSQCVGAGAYDRARYYMKKLTVATYAVMAFINITLILCIPLILRVYDVAPEAAVLAREVMLIHGGSAILLWLPSFMIPYFLRAAGDATYTMVVSMLTMWLVRVLGAYVIGRYLGYGVVGVWFAHAILDWATRSVIFYARYRSGKWERMAIRS